MASGNDSGPRRAISDRLALGYAARDAAELTIAFGGGTFDAATLAPVSPSTGYAVGGLALTVMTSVPDDGYERVARVILAQRDNRRAPYVGTWIENDIVYVDAVVILPDLESAGILARALGEKAIWDFANGISIAADRAHRASCRACGEPLYGTTRRHFHAENGKDVT